MKSSFKQHKAKLDRNHLSDPYPLAPEMSRVHSIASPLPSPPLSPGLLNRLSGLVSQNQGHHPLPTPTKTGLVEHSGSPPLNSTTNTQGGLCHASPKSYSLSKPAFSSAEASRSPVADSDSKSVSSVYVSFPTYPSTPSAVLPEVFQTSISSPRPNQPTLHEAPQEQDHQPPDAINRKQTGSPVLARIREVAACLYKHLSPASTRSKPPPPPSPFLLPLSTSIPKSPSTPKTYPPLRRRSGSPKKKRTATKRAASTATPSNIHLLPDRSGRPTFIPRGRQYPVSAPATPQQQQHESRKRPRPRPRVPFSSTSRQSFLWRGFSGRNIIDTEASSTAAISASAPASPFLSTSRSRNLLCSSLPSPTFSSSSSLSSSSSSSTLSLHKNSHVNHNDNDSDDNNVPTNPHPSPIIGLGIHLRGGEGDGDGDGDNRRIGRLLWFLSGGIGKPPTIGQLKRAKKREQERQRERKEREEEEKRNKETEKNWGRKK